MNSSERLQAIIQERREWEAFGWGVPLIAWALVLALKAAIEIAVGPRMDLGAGAFVFILAFQVVWALLPKAPLGARHVPMQGLWALVALLGWFFGSWAPGMGLLNPTASSVIELLFVANGLALTGFLKSRRSLVFGAAGLALAALVVAVFPEVWGWRPVGILATLGVAAVVSLVKDGSGSV